MFNNLQKYKNRIALVGEDKIKITYKKLIEESKNINDKIEKNSLILLVSDNTVPSILAYVSFLKNNHTTLIVDKNFDIKYLESIIKVYCPRYIFSPEALFIKKFFLKKKYKVENFTLFENHRYKKKKIHPKNFILLSTSGTTGNPKFVRISKKNILSNTKKIIEYLNINSQHTTITTMPMAYSYGISIINTHLEKGAKIIVNNNTVAERKFWEKLNEYKVNSFGGVPMFYEYLEKLRFEKFNTKYLKYLTQAGGKLKESQFVYLNKICKLKKINFYSMYGQTEASPRMSYLDPKKILVKKGSIGRPLIGSKFQLMDENKKIIKKPYINGELIFKGSNVSLGYAKNIDDLKKGDQNNKLLHTGDIAYRDEDNYYYIVGRKNRFIKLNGIRLNLDDIEKLLSNHKIIALCFSEDDKLFINLKNKSSEIKAKKILNEKFRIRHSEVFIVDRDSKKIPTNFKSVLNVL
jgi:acyl-coenzyme A synthetase/AMP-(fatty) acid ligase